MRRNVSRRHRSTRLAVYLAIVASWAGPASTQAPAASRAVETIVVADGVYLFRVPDDAFGGRGNSVAIVNDDDVTVFDTNMRPSSAELVIGEIRKLTSKPVGIVINSHWHQDHWSGNGVYSRAFPGVKIIASEETRDFMKAMDPTFALGFAGALKQQQAALDSGIKSGKKADGSAFTPEDRQKLETWIKARLELVEETAFRRTLPNSVYRNAMTFRSGKREIRLLSMDGDAAASTVLFLPTEKVLLVGDLVVHPNQWGNNGYQLKPWLENLRALKALGARVIVPGHGPAFKDDQYLSLVIELFETIRTQVRTALEQGAISLGDVKRAVKLDGIQAKFDAVPAGFYDDTLVKMAYREARDGLDAPE